MTRTINLPNLISLLRLLCVPLVVSLILSSQLTTAFLVFLIAGLSDALDGFLARILKARTTLGACLDPLADKALLVGTFAALGQLGLIDLWIVILVIFRDILIIGGILLLVLFNSSFSMKPLIISKINTVAQLTYVLCILGGADSLFGASFLTVGLGYLVVLTTVISGIEYVRLALTYFNNVDDALL